MYIEIYTDKKTFSIALGHIAKIANEWAKSFMNVQNR